MSSSGDGAGAGLHKSMGCPADPFADVSSFPSNGTELAPAIGTEFVPGGTICPSVTSSICKLSGMGDSISGPNDSGK